jgi:hypothetical protein
LINSLKGCKLNYLKLRNIESYYDEDSKTNLKRPYIFRELQEALPKLNTLSIDFRPFHDYTYEIDNNFNGFSSLKTLYFSFKDIPLDKKSLCGSLDRILERTSGCPLEKLLLIDVAGFENLELQEIRNHCSRYNESHPKLIININSLEIKAIVIDRQSTKMLGKPDGKIGD